MTPLQQDLPLRLFVIAFVFSILTTILGGTLSWQMHRAMDDATTNHLAVTRSIGHVMWLNEAIAMSARMVAASNDVAYEQRYHELVKQLAKELGTLKTLLPQAEARKFIQETDASSQLMGEMEQQAFTLAHEGKQRQALALLNGSEYVRLEKVYADGMKRTAQFAHDQIANKDRQLHTQALGMAFIGLLGVAVLLFVWFLALRAARHWALERKQAMLKLERANQQVQQQISLLVEALPLMLYTCRADGDFGTIYISTNVERVTGYSADCLMQDASFWGAHIHPDDQQPVHDALKNLFKQSNLMHEYRWQVADGSYRWFFDASCLVKDANGEPSHIVGAWLDITERKQAEIAMQASEAKFRTLYESSHDAMIIKDQNSGLFIDCNPAALAMFGCASADAFKRLTPASVSPEFQPDGRRSGEKAREMLRLAIANGSIFFEWTHQRLDGTQFYSDVLLTRINIGGEQLIEATVRDVSERKRHELALANAQRQLSTAYDLILQKNIQLQESNRARSEFLSAVSHELKTPLNAIIGFSDLLKENIAGPSNKEQHAFAVDINTAGIKLLGLLSDIIDFARLESGREHLEHKWISAETWLRDCILPWRERAAAKGLKFALHTSEPLGMLWLDATKARQILTSLLSNAVKFTKAGDAVTVTARRKPHADVRIATKLLPHTFAEYLEIEVRDTGAGFTAELLLKLFIPFHQGDGSLTRQHEGLGLGLAMVKALVEMQGGAVEAKNASDGGACVTVWLPWRERESDAYTNEAMPTLKNPHLALLIEDNANSAELIRLQLEQEGLQVVTATTAVQGLQLAASINPAFITLDILLPDMNGWDVLDKLKNSPKLAHIPVVVISIVADKKRGRSMGAVSVIQKPYKREELQQALADVQKNLLSTSFNEDAFMNEIRKLLPKS